LRCAAWWRSVSDTSSAVGQGVSVMSSSWRRRSARRPGWTSTAQSWRSSATSQSGEHGVTPVVIRASVLGRLLGIRLLRLEADITLVPADLGSSTVGPSPRVVTSSPTTGAEISPMYESCWGMRLVPSTRHPTSSRQGGPNHSGPGLIVTYQAMSTSSSRIRRALPGRSTVFKPR
jgi:hypothetical protein